MYSRDPQQSTCHTLTLFAFAFSTIHYYFSSSFLLQSKTKTKTLPTSSYSYALVLALFCFPLFLFLSVFFFYPLFNPPASHFNFPFLPLKYHFHFDKDTLPTLMITAHNLWLVSLSLSLSLSLSIYLSKKCSPQITVFIALSWMKQQQQIIYNGWWSVEFNYSYPCFHINYSIERSIFLLCEVHYPLAAHTNNKIWRNFLRDELWLNN